MKKLLGTLIISSALLFVGCKGDDGATGPAGPTGNANVKASHITIAPDQWVMVTDPNGFHHEYHYTAPQINSSLFNDGVVHAYYENRTATDGNNILLPVSWSNQSGQTIRRLSVYHLAASADTLQFWVEGMALTDTVNLKIVTIAGSAASYEPLVDFNNYNEVQQYFDLED